MNRRFLQTLGLCRRAGRLLRGRDETYKYLEIGKLQGVFLACDVSERTGRQVTQKCADAGVVLNRIPYSMEQLGQAVGGKPLGVFSVADKGLYRLLITTLAENKEADE